MEGDELLMLEKRKKEDDSIYSEKTREDLIEDGEISPEEAAFMQGYEEAL